MLSQHAPAARQHVGLLVGTTRGITGVLAGWLAELWAITLADTWASGDTLAVTVSKLDSGSNVIASSSLTHTATSATLATVAAAAVDQLQADVLMASYGAWTSSGAVITFTGQDRYAYTVSVTATTAGAGTATAANSQDYAAAADVAPGRCVIVDSYVGGIAQLKAPVATDFTARSVAVAVAPASSAIYAGKVTVNGTDYPFGPVAYTTDAATTNAAIATAACCGSAGHSHGCCIGYS